MQKGGDDLIATSAGDGSSKTAIAMKKSGSSKQPARALAILLAVLLCITGFPLVAGSERAEASERDITESVELELTHQALAEDGTWVDIDSAQIDAEAGDNAGAYRVQLNWALQNQAHRVSNGDYFVFEIANSLGGGAYREVIF
ncbi:hypothetical protein [Raoultibacter massiliensis]|uniref:Uncharacterized protein n=2 Tax=Raoultibacter massiliensis TaxID=1852371 RepID=A0ABV1JG64_9ACTN